MSMAQLAACYSLQNLIDDVHFYEDEFLEFVPACLELLFQFMRSAQEFDSKVIMTPFSCFLRYTLDNTFPAWMGSL